MYHSAVFVVLTALVHFCFGQGESCTTPNSQQGECKSVISCPPLLALVNNPGRTPQDTEFLRQSKCGYEGNVPTVCCPAEKAECTTPEGKSGKCVNLNSCTHIANLLKPPNRVTPDVIQYIQSTRCKSADPYSVCCGPPREQQNTTVDIKKGNCAARVTAFPPDPRTECCGQDGSFSNKIVGGNATSVDQYPWLVIIEYEKDGRTKLLCGGAAISGRYVLTAGHCVVGPVLDVGTPKRVRFGDYDIHHAGPDCVDTDGGGSDCTEGELKIDIEKVIPHPNYNPSHPQRRNDIALLRMSSMIPYTDFVRPICLPTQDYTLLPKGSISLFASGWGAVNDTKSFSSVKLYVDLPFVPQDTCQLAYMAPGRSVTLWKGQMCAGGQKGKDSCKGDSGGPLMHENLLHYEIIGVVSFGPVPCGLENIPGVYTKVFEYLDWIKSNIVN